MGKPPTKKNFRRKFFAVGLEGGMKAVPEPVRPHYL